MRFDEMNRDSLKRISHFLTKIWKIVVEMESVDRLLERRFVIQGIVSTKYQNDYARDS